DRAEHEFAYWSEQTRRAATTLADSGELTEPGAGFVAGIIETLDGWRDERISPEVTDRVGDLLLASTVDWRIRNHVPGTAEVARPDLVAAVWAELGSRSSRSISAEPDAVAAWLGAAVR